MICIPRLERRRVLHLVTAVSALAVAARAGAAEDPLPSWNEGSARRAILEFVSATTDQASPDFRPEQERFATFDNDGTLWVEQPMYTQVVFAFDRVRELAATHSQWRNTDPFRAILNADRESMAHFSSEDFVRVMTETHAGLTVAEFQEISRRWLAAARHPRFGRPYTELVYQPMLEVMRYLRANGFKTYIVTGGGQDFVRVIADACYGVPVQQVVGSAGKIKYGYDEAGRPVLRKLPSVLWVDDRGGKPEGIQVVIGRQPLAAFGNSIGDREMLEWTQAGGGRRLMMLVHHDDAGREYAYGARSAVGTFPDELMAEAGRRDWHVISMQRDWKRIFAWDGAPLGQPAD